MREEEYDMLEELYEEYLEMERRAQMTQRERDREDLISCIIGWVIIGVIVYLIFH